MALEITIWKKLSVIEFTLPWKHNKIEGDSWAAIKQEVLEYAFLNKGGCIIINEPNESSIYDEIPNDAQEYMRREHEKFLVSKVSRFSKELLKLINDEEFNRELLWLTSVSFLEKERLQIILNSHTYGESLPHFKDEVMFCTDGMFLFWFNPTTSLPNISSKYIELANKYDCKVVVKEEGKLK